MAVVAAWLLAEPWRESGGGACCGCPGSRTRRCRRVPSPARFHAAPPWLVVPVPGIEVGRMVGSVPLVTVARSALTAAGAVWTPLTAGTVRAFVLLAARRRWNVGAPA